MTLDRSEIGGTGAALLFHVALIAALSTSLARVDEVPEPPAMEVELVEAEAVALTAAAPSAVAAPAPAEQAPQIERVPEPDQPRPVAQPLPPAPRIDPTPAPRVERAAPKPPPRATRPAPPRPAAKASRLGDDFLKGIAEAQPSPAARPAAAASVSASAMAGIVQAIRRRVQPCADRQVSPGPGASRIKVRLRLQLTPAGRLVRPPQVLGTTGVDEENSRYEERVKDLAVATFVGCAPLTGLPPELYETISGRGWSDFIMNYNLP
jgi:hypothetical protein